MDRDSGLGIDWRDAAAYAPLLEADRSILAWEWLRRDGRYRSAARACADGGARGSARSWGLHAFEDPDLAAPHARPVWRAEVHAAVLAAVAGGRQAAEDAFDLGPLEALATLLRFGDGPEHLLLCDGLLALRVDILAGSLASGAVELRYLLGGVRSAEAPLLTLRRLLALCRDGGFRRSLHRPEARARRNLLVLRARDATAAGAGQREIAASLLGRGAAGPRWRSEAPSLRSQAQRLVRSARLMADGGYLALLR